jgi:hypothetical protein
MARLRIQAAASPGAAEEANKQQLNFAVSITRHDGDAVKDLDAEAFDLQSPIVGPGGPPADIGDVNEFADGVYILSVFPHRPWARGTYLYILTVEHHDDRGQTVVPVTVPGV